MAAPVIHWFRRDLRLTDNLALDAAARTGAPVIPVFIFDPAILRGRYFGVPRLAWLIKTLAALDARLRRQGARLLIRQGSPRRVLAELAAQTGAAAVYLNRDYTPYALRRDEDIKRMLNIPVYVFDDGLLHPPGAVLKPDQTPFAVFTPFKKKWLTLDKTPSVGQPGDCFIPAGGLSLPFDDLPTLAALGFDGNFKTPEAGEEAAQRRLYDFLARRIHNYQTGRDRLASDPDDDTRGGWSFLSPYFRFGLISPRQVYWAAREAYREAGTPEARRSVEQYIGELIWREFYAHILHFHPHALDGNFRPEYDVLQWRDEPNDLQAWTEGRTGYPVVDAAMRQLQHMGWMPNRARMIAASFLTKDLLINWQAGERFFMQWLIDGDPAQNNGGWQWTAGTGTDAQPYFRVFNPVSQSQKFDPDGAYIRRWLPELRGVPLPFIHAPWTMDSPPRDYPPPIADHAFARERALAAFGAARQNQGDAS